MSRPVGKHDTKASPCQDLGSTEYREQSGIKKNFRVAEPNVLVTCRCRSREG